MVPGVDGKELNPARSGRRSDKIRSSVQIIIFTLHFWGGRALSKNTVGKADQLISDESSSPALHEVSESRETDEVAFPVIPTEINLAILEALVGIQTPTETMELATLSHSLKPFIERLLYHSVSFVSERQLSLFLNVLKSGSRPLSFYQDRIRHVCAKSWGATIEDSITLISACCNARTFAVRGFKYEDMGNHNETLTALNFYSSLSILRPNRLHISLMRNVSTTSPGLDWLRHVTHLELNIAEKSSDVQFNDTILRLPQLTHLAYCSSLRLSARIVVCIVWDYSMGVQPSINERDPRIIFRYGSNDWPQASEYVLVRNWSLESFIQDWSKKGHEAEMWELAEVKVEFQRRHLEHQDLQKSS
ncbi:hypothetical protein C8J56DRAFT_1021959 [Mycena floridula]|nr:hypothetical protein C8J56DRAFT_1021959 [Mycena floridula]